MPPAFVRPPSASEYLSDLKGGNSGFRYPVFKVGIKGRRGRQFLRGGCGGSKRKRAVKRLRRRVLKGEGVQDVIRFITAGVRRIPGLFRSKAAKKLLTNVAASGVSTGINIGLDKLRNRPKTPMKQIAKEHGKEFAADVLEKAKAQMGGKGGRRRRGGRRKKAKRLRGGRKKGIKRSRNKCGTSSRKSRGTKRNKKSTKTDHDDIFVKVKSRKRNKSKKCPK
jgi:hypothetical protein